MQNVLFKIRIEKEKTIVLQYAKYTDELIKENSTKKELEKLNILLFKAIEI